ncbi:MAG: double-strand break repair protein AddB [Rhodospirillales bacterium]|nr:double-strand break repair protein AddB [Rhodospirillales bacterium]
MIENGNQPAKRDAAKVFTIPAGTPFLDSLATGILSRTDGRPEALTAIHVLLPTRRACRGLRDAFLGKSDGRPLLLPRLTPLGDIDEDELAIDEAVDGSGSWLTERDGAAGIHIPPAIPGLRRQILLARLVLAMSANDKPLEQAVRLANELARLLDQVHTEKLSFNALPGLVPDDQEFARHWQMTLDFLTIVSEQWPKILEAEGCIDAADRRNRLLSTRAAAWLRSPPEHPVIAAGSTGSIPATAELLAVISRLPDGSVVLPGLDREMGDVVSAPLPPSHPQFGMRTLLDKMDVEPDRVPDWPATADTATPRDRRRLINIALHPAEASHRWHEQVRFTEDCLNGLSRVDCPGPREEAGVIALMMREALETNGETAALVTPDRLLARRVASELGRWGIEVDDSAGRPLAQTPPAVFFLLLARMIAEDFAPLPLLSALKHPLAACGKTPSACRAVARRIEILALRGPRPSPGLDGLRRRLEDHEDCLALLDHLETTARPMLSLLSAGPADTGDLIAALVGFAEACAETPEESGAERLWAGENGEAMAAFVAELLESANLMGKSDRRLLAGFLRETMAGRVVRPRFGLHPRLHIWGPLEARLQQTDILILGGLNEGTWPPETHAGPWMSRPMMHAFGLPLPERRIGLAAHDFAQAACARRVVLTRATRVAGTPTVPSRWLLRLETLMAASGLGRTLQPNRRWLSWFDGLDSAPRPAPVSRPEPKPPLSARPKKLSVTQIETLIRDPYAIFAREILGLKRLDPIDADPTAAERGIVVHEALDRFTRAFRDSLPDDAMDRLLEIGRRVFDDHMHDPAAQAFWWPRFERLSEWFVDHERSRRAGGVRLRATEVRGSMRIDLPGMTFLLTGRADRIDRLPTGKIAIIDYKTGQVPSWKQVKSGLVPQLSLEAAMAAAGDFDDVPAAEPAELVYLRLTGGRTAGQVRTLEDGVPELAAEARDGLKRMIAAFSRPDTPYLSRPRPMFARAQGEYDHLARVKEWTVVGGEE